MYQRKIAELHLLVLKGRFDVCEIDLHQRREYVTHENKKLNRKTKIRHLKMNQAEVNIENADARVIYALFNDTSVTGKLMTYLNADSLDSSTDGSQSLDYRGSSYLRWLENVEISDGDFSWYDPKDFIELELGNHCPHTLKQRYCHFRDTKVQLL